MLFLLTPLTSALIGYVTNKMAIKMLFYPRRPVMGIQGLLVKRKQEYAKKLSQTVVERFLADGLEDVLPEKKIYEMIEFIANNIAESLADEVKLPVNPSIVRLVRNLVAEDIQNMIKEKIPGRQATVDNLKSALEKNIRELPDQEVETLLTEISSREFRQIEYLGGRIGKGSAAVFFRIVERLAFFTISST